MKWRGGLIPTTSLVPKFGGSGSLIRGTWMCSWVLYKVELSWIYRRDRQLGGRGRMGIMGWQYVGEGSNGEA